MSAFESFLLMSPLHMLKEKYNWRPVFIQFGNDVRNIENYISTNKSHELSLVLMHCALHKYNKDKIIHILKNCFCSVKFKKTFEKIEQFQLQEIYIGGIQYTDTILLQSNGLISKKGR